MFRGQLKLYLRDQVGHDLSSTPGLALPPVNPFINKATKQQLISHKLTSLNFETIWLILECLGIESRVLLGRKASEQAVAPPYTLRWDGEFCSGVLFRFHVGCRDINIPVLYVGVCIDIACPCLRIY
jgi:hypothetical protein